jgi:thioesterase domain-containing protein
VGHSSGGWLAHALAERLERSATGPCAVVLIDTYPTDTDTSSKVVAEGLAKILARGDAPAVVSDERLAASAA